MNCAINKEQQLLLVELLTKYIQSESDKNNKTSTQGFITNLHNMLTELTDDKDLALDYTYLSVNLLPRLLTSKVLKTYKDNLRKQGVSFDELSDLENDIEDNTQNLQYLQNYLGLSSNPIQESKDTQEVAKLVQDAPASKLVASKTPVNSYNEGFSATSSTVNKDKESEVITINPDSPEYNVRDTKKTFFYKVKRAVIKLINDTNKKSDYLKKRYGVTKFQYRITDIRNIPSQYLKEGDKNNVSMPVALLVDENNNPLLFDENLEISPNGKMVYFNNRVLSKDNFKGGQIVLDTSSLNKDDVVAMNIMKARKISFDEARDIVIDQLERLHKINEHVLSGNDLVVEIVGGSLGHVERGITPLNKITNPFTINLYEKDNSDFPDGMFYLNIPDAHGVNIDIERGTITEEMAEKLTSLLVDPIMIPSGDGMRDITIKERILHLSYYIDIKSHISFDLNPNTWGITVYGVKYPLFNKESRLKNRDKIKDYFSGLQPIRKKTYHQLTSEQKKNVVEVSDISNLSSVPNLKVNSVVKFNDEYWIVEHFKLNIRENVPVGADNRPLQDFDIVQSNGKNVIQYKNDTYNNWILNNHFAKAKTNAQGEILRLNPYLIYDISDEVINSIEKKELPEDKPIEYVTPVETKTTDDLINDEKSGFDKNIFQSFKNKEVLLKQLEEARHWYEASEIGKKVPFTQMFDIINRSNPDTIAKWNMAGIALYHGSNYTDLYHEAWHAFTQLFLTREQKDTLYETASKMKGSFTTFNGQQVQFSTASKKALEEWLAEDFRNFMLTGEVKGGNVERKNIFQKIWDLLKALFDGYTVEEIINDGYATKELSSLYNKLKIGNLNEYKFDRKNADFLELESGGIQKTNEDETRDSLTFEESELVVKSMDAIIAETIDSVNTDRETHKYTTRLMKGENNIKRAYNIIKLKFIKRKEELEADLKKETDTDKKNNIIGNINMLTWVLNNYGSTENLKDNTSGVIAYHQKKSYLITEEDRASFKAEAELEDEVYENGRDGRNKNGNEMALVEMGAEEVIALLRGIPELDNDLKPKKNRLGFTELLPFNIVWNRLTKTLAGSVTLNEMYKRLQEKNWTSFPEVRYLFSRLGPLETTDPDAYNLWSKFQQTFNKTQISLIDTTIRDTKDGYEITLGNAYGEVNKVGTIWSNKFNTRAETPWIKHEMDTNNRRVGNYLDVKQVLEDFPRESLRDNRENKLQFLKAIGIDLDDNDDILKELESYTKLRYVYSALEQIAERPDVVIKKLSDIFKEYSEKIIKGVKYPKIDNNANIYKDLRNIQARNSDSSSNFSVTNAKGDLQFEHSLNNTITMIANTINQVDTFQELMSLDYMKHLDPKRNPFTKHSWWLNSIFYLQDEFGNPLSTTDMNYGHKRQLYAGKEDKVEILFNNLSGIKYEDSQGQFSEDLAQATASSDKMSKLITELNNVIGYGRFELMRHADKGTAYSTQINKLYGDNKFTRLYVPVSNFVHQSIDDVNVGYNLAANKLLEYMSSELERINELKNDKYNQNYDFKYRKAGSDFVYFETILSPESNLKEELKALTIPLHDYLQLETPESRNLEAKLKAEIFAYFDKKYKEMDTMFGSYYYLGKNIENQIFGDISNRKGELNLKHELTASEKRTAILKAFVINSWIHNYESTVLFYGDLALYKMEKEEFHKRNAGAASTGTTYRFDKASFNFINLMRRKEISIALGNEHVNFNGQLNTAILEDKTIQSVYLEDYKKVISDDIYKRFGNTAEADEIIDKIMSPYTKMDEGDAQGWITLDSYRQLLSSEGTWTDLQEDLYQKIVKKEPVTAQEMHEYFPVQKLQYWGALKTEGLPLTAFHKFSLMPLIPTMIVGTTLQKLNEKMMRENIDYAAYQTASKISTIKKDENTTDKLYTNSKSLSREFDEAPFTANTIFIQYLKNQVKIHSHYKNKVIFPTQLRKLIESGLMEAGVPFDYRTDVKDLNERVNLWEKESNKQSSKIYSLILKYEDNIKKLTALKKDQLLKEFNWSLNDEGIPTGSISDLLDFIKKEFGKQDLGEHELDFLRLNNKGELMYDLSLSLSVEKFETMLNSIVINRLVKQKVYGEQYVLASSSGFERKDHEEDKRNNGSNELPSYQQQFDDKGNAKSTKAAKVKIPMTFGQTINGKYIPSEFEKLTQLIHNDGNPINTVERLNEMLKSDEWLDKKQHRRMVTLIGTRIPVQGLNSMEFLEIQEFLSVSSTAVLIPPPEMVAKSGSDYDIDKIFIIKPRYQSINGELSIATEKSDDELRTMYKEFVKAKVSFDQFKVDGKFKFADEKFGAKLSEILGNNWRDDYTNEDIDVLAYSNSLKSFENFKQTFVSEKAISNDILWNIKEILALPENFVKLITPNATYLVQDIAEELSDYVRDFKFRKNGRVQGTTVLEIPYNLYKHESNNIGKQTLGMGAVDNTYNVLFNRIKAKMNYTSGMTSEEYEALSDLEKAKVDYRVLTMALPHNTLKDDKGRDVISLSHNYGKDGNDISEIISQLINGWVDVAKDAWVFDIQGNKELANSLLFMIQSGVPLRTAIYMVSNPLVREYVANQRLLRSSYAKVFGIENDMGVDNKARQMVLSNPDNQFNAGSLKPRAIYKVGREVIDAVVKKGNFNTDILEALVKPDKERDANVNYDEYQRAAFYQFLEIEDMANAVRDVKLRMNVDTNKSKTIFAAEKKIADIETLSENVAIDTNMVDKLQDASPISSFFTQRFQTQIWKDLFKLRNHSELNEFIIKLFKTPALRNVIKTTLGKEDKFVNTLRNDFLSYIYQNIFNQFDITKLKTFKKLDVQQEIPIQDVPFLTIGAIIKDGVFYVDYKRLLEQYQDKTYARSTYTFETLDYKKLDLARVNALAFTTFNSYARFVLEREYLRSIFTLSDAMEDKEYNAYYRKHKSLIKKVPSETDVAFDERVDQELYEMYLRDKALDNTDNVWKLFKSDDSYAIQFFDLKDEFPDVWANYNVLNFLNIGTTKTGTSNLKLLDPKLDQDQINIFHEELNRLANPNIIKTADSEDNFRLSMFFDKMSKIALLQSGYNTKGIYSLIRIVPQEKYMMLMSTVVEDITNNLNQNILEDYYRLFLRENNMSKGADRLRNKEYASDYSIEQSKKSKRGESQSIFETFMKIDQEYLDVITLNRMSNIDELDKILTEHGGNVLLYNTTKDKKSLTDNKGNLKKKDDKAFNFANESNKAGLTVYRALDKDGNAVPFKDKITKLEDGTTVQEVSDEFKALIDDEVRMIEEQLHGRKPIFTSNGYGTEMFIAYDTVSNEYNEDVVARRLIHDSKENYKYLSKVLLEKFNFENPLYLGTEAGKKQAQKEMERKYKLTDQEAINLIKKCKGV